MENGFILKAENYAKVVQLKRFGEKEKMKILNFTAIFITKILQNHDIILKEIEKVTNTKFKSLEDHIKRISHEKHEGNYSSTALTSVNSKTDTRKDKRVRAQIANRPYRQLNGTFRPAGLAEDVMVSVSKKGIVRVMTTLLSPSDRAIVIKAIRNLI